MNIRQFNRIVEIRTKIISMGTFLCGSLYAVAATGSWSWTRFFLMAVAVLAVDMGTTGFNSYFDYTSGTDRAELNFERDKVLVHEGVSPHIALAISLTLFGIAAILGLILASLTSWYLIPAGAVCMAVGFFYTGGPMPISRTPFGELFAGGFLGTILFMLSYYVQTLSVSFPSFIVSLPLLLLIGLILTVNNTCDRVADKAAGRKTLSILLSERSVRVLMHGTLFISYLLPIIFALTQLVPLAVVPFMIIAYIPAINSMRHMQKQGFSLHTKGASMNRISQLFLLYCVAFIFGLLGVFVS